MKLKIYQKVLPISSRYSLVQWTISIVIIGLSLTAACTNPNEDNAKNDGPTERSSDHDRKRSNVKSIKNNVLWESFSDSEGGTGALYFVGWQSNNLAAFISSQESYECGGFNSSIFIQNLINDKILVSQEIANNCDDRDWTHNGNQILPILKKSNITISRNPRIYLADGGQYTDIATNHKNQIFSINIELSNGGNRYKAIATAPNGKEKVIGRGSDHEYYKYIGYVQSPDLSRIALVLRAYIGYGYWSDPIIIGCKLDENSF